MKTDCVQAELGFQELGSREVRASFDAGQVTSDAGALLLREVGGRTRLIENFAACFRDSRDSRYVVHDLPALIAQRVYALTYLVGPEGLDNSRDLRHLIDVVATYKATDKVTYGLNYDLRFDEHGTGSRGTAASIW